MKKSVAELMDEICTRLEAFESSLPKRINAMEVSQGSKLPYKVLLYREALIWRMVELCRGAFENFTKDKLVSGIVLTRAAVETSAALWYLCAKVDDVVDSGAVGDIDEYLMKMLMGTATEAPKVTASREDVELPRPIKVRAFLKQWKRTLKDLVISTAFSVNMRTRIGREPACSIPSMIRKSESQTLARTSEKRKTQSSWAWST